MPEGSHYRQQARADYEKLRPGYVADHLERADAALKNSRCTDFKAQFVPFTGLLPAFYRAALRWRAIPSLRILLWSVVGFSPKSAAAPVGP
jgi:hypothetical protein